MALSIKNLPTQSKFELLPVGSPKTVQVIVINAVFKVLHGFSLASPAEEEQEMVVDHFEMQQSKPDAWFPTCRTIPDMFQDVTSRLTE